MLNIKVKGAIYVAIGASSYGMLTTFVKMAYREGFSTAEVTISQYILGAFGLLLLNVFSKKKAEPKVKPATRTGIKLILAGSSLGLTSAFLYLAVQYVSVSVGIILLMLTVWMGVVVELIIHKSIPERRKLFAVVIILGGTVLATALGQGTVRVNLTGISWGLLAALSYTATMYSSNSIGLQYPPLKRSLLLISGGLLFFFFFFFLFFFWVFLFWFF